MADEVTPTPEGAVIPTPEKTEEKTVAEIIDNASPKKEPEMVGLDKFLELKKENKELKRSFKDLEARIESGATSEDVSDDIDSLAEAHDVDKKFLQKLVKAIESKTEKSLEERVNAKLAPLTEKDKQSKINAAFNSHFNKVIETMPEYKDIVNPEVIKALSLEPSNSNKTFPQLIEDTYGRAISGKRTIETAQPGGGKEPEPLDINRAKRDTEYFKEVMADPKKKAVYNEAMLKSGF